jgi:hypothetical protein
MVKSLPTSLQKQYKKTLDEVVLNNMSPNGSMLPETYQMVDSSLKKAAREWSSQGNSMLERQVGDALRELQDAMAQTVAKTNPEFAAAKKAADTGWAKLKVLEGASGKAGKQGGVFTPYQYSQAIKQSAQNKSSVNTGRGYDQDLARAAEEVLGNYYPDSGTAGRFLNVATAAAGLHNPLIPALAGAGAAGYTKPVQNFLVKLIADRPDLAPRIAREMRRMYGPAGVAGGVLAAE